MADDQYAVINYAYSVDISMPGQEAAKAYFTSVGGLTSESDVTTTVLVAQSGKTFTQLDPGRVKWQDITLKKPLQPNSTLAKWSQTMAQKGAAGSRSDVTIHMHNHEGQIVFSWIVTNAWPSKLSVTAMNSGGNELLMEELTLSHEGFKLDGAAGSPMG